MSFSKVNLNKKEEIKFEHSTENQFIKNMLTISYGILKQTLKNGEDILIKINVPEKGTITLLNTFKTNLKETSIHFKSKIVYDKIIIKKESLKLKKIMKIKKIIFIF